MRGFLCGIVANENNEQILVYRTGQTGVWRNECQEK